MKARWSSWRHNRSLPSDAPVLHFWPMWPHPKSHVVPILRHLGIRIGHDPAEGEPVIAWDSDTWFRQEALRRLPRDAINANCLDISKTRVDLEWAVAAGYGINVDPLTWDGALVIKGDANGVHNGRIVQAPLPERRDGVVYQRVVNAVEGTAIIEGRTPVIDGTIPCVIQRWRKAADWDAYATRAELRTTEDFYSADEVATLVRFAAAMHLDYGELDVLRDKDSGRIYVLDCNRAAYGPPRKMGADQQKRVLELMTPAFRGLMERRWPGSTTRAGRPR